jgi:hypothetical protein|tara:strand:- start:1931 stop:2098 length:168 start_codon:yes stop_codon:yes gene_type:complete
MADWTDPDFLQALFISIFGLSVAGWWLSSKISSKLSEIEERKGKKKPEDPPSGGD